MRADRDFTVTGVGGTITWHYFPAADVVAFTITCDRDERWSLRATIVNGNAYNLAQTPLLFRMPRLRGTWCWPLLRVERVDATLTARLGTQFFVPKEVTADAPLPLRPTIDRATAYLRGGLDRRQTGPQLR